MTAAAPAKPACSSCADVGRKGYCAPGRCYCGHESCHAFGSWAPLPDLTPADAAPARETTPTTPTRSSWDDREDSTWIDKL